MVQDVRFDGRVAVVTGAGAGLGRAYALLFGERGASVVVNDLGGSRDGGGASSKAADSVVQEIRSRGGKAVADYNSVVDGHKIIQTALDNFGRVDIVVNNAGILRDRSIPRLTDQDWDLIQDVHLKGSFKTTQAAWPHMKAQNYGRVIMTSSQSGLCGNFGQANYSAAKMALVGLSNTVSIEGKKNNIHCNVIVPTAGSRLTEDILPPDLFAELRPELIAPVVVWLCHEDCEDTGSIIDSAAGWAGKWQLTRSSGSLLREDLKTPVTLETVKSVWGRVTDMSDARPLPSIQHATGDLMGMLETLRESEGKKIVKDKHSYNYRDLILYNLGVGATMKNPADLRFLYEGHEDFSVIPSFGIIPGQLVSMGSGLIETAVPGKTIDLSRLLHGEQFFEQLSPLKTSGTLESRVHIADVMDKGKGAVVLMNVETFDEDDVLVGRSQMSVFLVGAGGFGGPRSSDKVIPTVDAPKRAPDASRSQTTVIDQAALYRLSGDTNPLHIDSTFAAFGGFDRPILHGMCTLGFSVKHVLDEYGGSDPANFRALKVRFTNPVLPGQTIKTDMWRQGNRILFQSSVAETGSVVISGAYIDLHKVVPSISPRNVAGEIPVSHHVVSGENLQSEGVFNAIKVRLENDVATAKKINGVFLYVITKNGKPAGKWIVDLKQGKLYKGDAEQGVKVDTTLTVDDQDMVDIATGKLNPQVAFMKGKLKITGNIMLTQKLQALVKTQSKL